MESTSRVMVYRSELRAIAAEANKHPDQETGGDLYGLWTHGQRPVVFLATGPGPGASGRHSDFQQDHHYIMDCERILYNSFGIQYLGDWHSHHWIGMSTPSKGDVTRAHRVLSRSNRQRIVEIIVNHMESRDHFPLKKKKKPKGKPRAELLSSYLYFGMRAPAKIDITLLDRASPIRQCVEDDTALKHLNLNQDWTTFPFNGIVTDFQSSGPHVKADSAPGFLQRKMNELWGMIKLGQNEGVDESGTVSAVAKSRIEAATGKYYSDDALAVDHDDKEFFFLSVPSLGAVIFVIDPKGDVTSPPTQEFNVNTVALSPFLGSPEVNDITDQLDLESFISEARPIEAIVDYLKKL